MILYQEVNSSTELEGEDHEQRDTFAYTYAIAACPAAATATAESTIKEIAVGKQDEAPVKGQQGFSMGAGEYKFTTIGGGHASFKVLTTVGGKGEFLKWGWMKAKIMSTSHTLQPPAYKFPKPSKSSTQSNSSSRLSQPDNKKHSGKQSPDHGAAEKQHAGKQSPENGAAEKKHNGKQPPKHGAAAAQQSC